jgi:hypothetical protein
MFVLAVGHSCFLAWIERGVTKASSEKVGAERRPKFRLLCPVKRHLVQASQERFFFNFSRRLLGLAESSEEVTAATKQPALAKT